MPFTVTVPVPQASLRVIPESGLYIIRSGVIIARRFKGHHAYSRAEEIQTRRGEAGVNAMRAQFAYRGISSAVSWNSWGKCEAERAVRYFL